MKVFSIFHDGNELAIHNNMLGVETIYFNGQEMSSKFSFWGETHLFAINNKKYLVEIGFGWWGVACNIWIDNQPIFIGLHQRARRRLRQQQTHSLGSDFV
jgi:hypothetical protein